MLRYPRSAMGVHCIAVSMELYTPIEKVAQPSCTPRHVPPQACTRHSMILSSDWISRPNPTTFSCLDKTNMKQKAVVVTHFDKEHPENAVEVVEKDVPKPGPGTCFIVYPCNEHSQQSSAVRTGNRRSRAAAAARHLPPQTLIILEMAGRRVQC